MSRWSLVVLSLLLGPPTAVAAPATARAPDGAAVTLDVEGEGPRAVLLVHDDAGAPSDWSTARDRLAARGLLVAAVGLRGTPGARDEATWGKAALDVTAALAWLRERGASEVVLVGAGAGGTVALHVAAADPRVSGVVVLSPRLSSPPYKVSDALAAYGSRPLLLVASRADAAGARAANALAGANGTARVELVDTPGQGARLLTDAPRLEGELLAWITARPWQQTAKPAAALTQGEVGTLETTGTRWER